MKEFLKNILPRIKSFSQELDIVEKIIDKPWVWISNGQANQKLIFRRDGILLMVKEGDVQTGKWDFISSINSLLIDRNVDKILMNYAFVDDSIMLLKKDGNVNDEIIAFVNQNAIPNLNYADYLTKLSSEVEQQGLVKQQNQITNSESLSVEKEVVQTFFYVVDVQYEYKVHIFRDFNINPENQNIFNQDILNGLITRENQIYFGDTILKDGYYSIPDRIFNEIPRGQRIDKILHHVKNGYIIEQFKQRVLRFPKKSIDVYKSLNFTNDLLGSAVFQINSFISIPDGKYKLESFSHITVKNGRVIEHTKPYFMAY